MESVYDYAFYKNSDVDELILNDAYASSYVFYSIKDSLRCVTIFDSVSEIPSGMFSGFEALSEITILEGVDSIARNAIVNCPALTKVNLPRTISIIDDENFTDCPALLLTVYPDSYAENWAEKNAVPYAYNDQKSIAITLPEEDLAKYAGLSLVLAHNGTEYIKTMDGSLKYVFYGIEENGQYQLFIRNALGYRLSEVHPITIGGSKTEVQIPQLYENASVHLTIRDSRLKNVSDSAEILWTDREGNQIAVGQDVHNMPLGTELTAHVSISGQIALEYDQPSQLNITVNRNSSAVSLYLKKNENENDFVLRLAGIYTSAHGMSRAYDAWENVLFRISNETSGMQNLAYVMEGNELHLGSQVNAGDQVKIRMEAVNNDFLPAEKTIIIAADATVDYAFAQRGILSANYQSEGTVTMFLYDHEEKLVWTGFSGSGSIDTIGLTDGTYAAVLISSEACAATPYKRADLLRLGLTENDDYLIRTVTIRQGTVTMESFGQVPETYAIGSYFESVSFTTNSKAPKAGKYFTLKASAKLRDSFESMATDMYWAIQLPEKCVIAGETLTINKESANYNQQENGLIIIPVEHGEEMLRVCLLPLAGGEYEIEGTFNFTENGEKISLPMTPVRYAAEGLTISVPGTTNSVMNNASGKVSGTAQVTLYDNDVEVARTETDKTGAWNVDFELVNAYTYTSHRITATFETVYGVIESEPALIQYHYVENPIYVKSVTLRTNAHGSDAVNMVIPMINGHLGESTAASISGNLSFLFNTLYPEIAFDVEVEGSNLSALTGVYVILELSNGKTTTLAAEKTSETKWICQRNFQSYALPTSVSVELVTNEDIVFSNEQIANMKEIDEMADENIDYDMADLLEDVDGEFETINNLLDEYNTYLAMLSNAQAEMTDAATELLEMVYDGNSKFYNPALPNFYIEVLSNSKDSLIQSRSISLNGSIIQSYVDANNPGREIIKINNECTISKPTASSYFYDPSLIGNKYDEIIAKTDRVKAIADPINDKLQIFGNMLDAGVEIVDLSKKVLNQEKSTNSIKYAKTQEEIKVLDLEINRLENAGSLTHAQEGELLRNQHNRNVLKSRLNLLDRNNGKIDEALIKLSKNAKAFAAAKSISRAISGVGLGMDGWDIINLGRDAIQIGELIMKEKQKNPNANVDDLWALLGEIAVYTTAKVGMVAVDIVSCFPGIGLEIGAIPQIAIGVYDAHMKEEHQSLIETAKLLHSDISNPDNYHVTSNKIQPILDPNGFVYEAVLSNRLEGVEATIWQKETKYDIYDDPYEEISQWDAGSYNQINPQITGGDGTYAWDVPDGLWQVRLWKKSYEEVQSDWLIVPPPQTDVNLGMVSMVAPRVKQVSVSSEAVTIEFDKYMNIASIEGNIGLRCNDETVQFVLIFPDAEEDPNNSQNVYARYVQLTLANSLPVGAAIDLVVNEQVTSYAGVTMNSDYQYESVLRGIETFTAEDIELIIDEEKYINVSAGPAEVTQGLTVSVSGDLEALGIQNSMIRLNSFGRANLKVLGHASGTYHLHFALEGSEMVNDVTVAVTSKPFSFTKNRVALAAGLPFADEMVMVLDDRAPESSEIVWATSDDSVVTVQDGLIKAVGAGNAIVTAAAGGYSAECNVRVYGDLHGLKLPTALSEIDEEAFRGIGSFQYVIIPEGILSIGDYAFADNDSLLFVYIPSSVHELGNNIFSNSDYVVICSEGDVSLIENYCKDYGLENGEYR